MNNALMAPRKNKHSEASKAIAKAILEQYQPISTEEMQPIILPSHCKVAFAA